MKYEKVIYRVCRGGGNLSSLRGFTLAEVLITLGIIGVVAALTMPALIQNYKKYVHSVKLKKFYSTMQQSIQLYNVYNDTLTENWSWWFPVQNVDYIENFWNTYLASNFKNILKTEKQNNTFYIYFSDGYVLRIQRFTYDSLDIVLFLNKDYSKSYLGKDAFYFSIWKTSGFIPYQFTGDIDDMNNNLTPDEVKYTKDMHDRNNLINLCKKERQFCTQLLMHDGWEFKKDYPHKL